MALETIATITTATGGKIQLWGPTYLDYDAIMGRNADGEEILFILSGDDVVEHKLVPVD